MVKINFVLLLLTAFIISCNSQSNNEILKSIKKMKPNEDKTYDIYMPIMNELLDNNSFKRISGIDFNERVLEYSGVNSDTSKVNDVYLEKAKGFYAILSGTFLDIYQLDRGKIDRIGNPFMDILKEGNKNAYNVDFINYNKILFNDDEITIIKCINNKRLVEDIVIYLNYEKSDSLIKNVVRNIKVDETTNSDYLNHLLFYNNNNKKNIIRNNLLKSISNSDIYQIVNIKDLILNSNIQLNCNEDIKIKCIAYLINLILENDVKENHFDLGERLGYWQLEELFKKDPIFLNVFNKEEFYGYPLLKQATQTYKTLAED
jgi:hypothetical protein